jgi:beta-mannosidase
VNLTGDAWSLENRVYLNVSDVKATVPGQVHLDLLKAGIIKEPYHGYNQRDQQWIANDEWRYSRDVNINRTLMKFDYLWLQCDGIDTASTITFNSHLISTTNSMFRKFLFDIRYFVSEGRNGLVIDIQSALKYSEQMKGAYPYDVPAPGTYIAGGARNFIRKAQSDFGWDWGPAFVPAGIWRNIGLVAFDVGLVTSVSPRVSYDDTLGVFSIDITICGTVPDKSSLPIYFESATSFQGETSGTRLHITEYGDFCTSELSLEVESQYIKMWYPTGYGEPAMYKITITTSFNDSTGLENFQKFERSFGFRYIELVQDNVPNGKTFYFKINGIPVFAKGSNFIPADAFHNRATPDYLRKLLQSAKDANQNMVRVWGGGIYQSDEFYDICDELGIMVWQDFMFAVALYPRDTDFLENVAAEVTDQVLRLTHHPSIVLWGGNNENQDIALEKGPAYTVDYSKLYDDVVHTTLASLKTAIPYWPSSPSNGYMVDDPSRGLFIQRWGSSQDPNYGDIHRYDYTDPCTDVSKFPNPRFASEFGLQSYPSVTSWLEVSDPSMWGNNSTFMNWRQHLPDGNELMYNQVKYYAKVPNNPNKTRQFEDFVYLTQVVQMVCITAEIEHYRRIRNESHTMGTLYWQLNDIWQAQTWSSLEYGGRWKLLHNGVKRAYDKFLISGYLLDKNFTVYMISDDFEKAHSTYFELRFYTWEGKLVNIVKGNNISLPALTSMKVFTEKSEVVFEGCGIIDNCLVTLSMGDMNGAPLAENSFVPSLVNAPLQHAKLDFGDKEIQRNVATFTVTTDNVAPFVYLYTKVNGYFSNNGFLALPGKPVGVTFIGDEDLDEATFWDLLQFKSIRDTYQ